MECVQQIKHQDECYGKMTAIQFTNDKPTPATSSSLIQTYISTKRTTVWYAATNYGAATANANIRHRKTICTASQPSA